MEAIEQTLAINPRYIDLLGKQQALNLLEIFREIESGKYDKTEVHAIELKGFKAPVFLRSIRADMQSFINTFIDPYLDKKPYLSDAKVILDAGGNIGYTAVLFANWWPGCKIISMEPDFENYQLILKNTAKYPNIEVLNCALWNKEASLSIEAGQEDGFVVREISDSKEAIRAENLTSGISVDQLFANYNISHIDLLKMNIEGSEKEVFSENYRNWLPKTTVMLIELHDGKNSLCSKAVFSAISEYDFSVAETMPYGILFVKEAIYRAWYSKWYKETIYDPNINKERFPDFYLDRE